LGNNILSCILFLLSLAFIFLGLQLQLAYSQNQNQNQNQTEILCNELAILNTLVQDTETLPSTAAGNSTSERECGFKPNIAKEGNQSSNDIE
jgi:hypothetical protein